MKRFILITAAFSALIAGAAGCVSPQVKLFTDAADPLREYTLSGEAEGKVLLVPVRGIITDNPEDEMFRTRPSPVQEIVSQLEMAAADPAVKAVVIKIDSPGGTVTASDIIYNEIISFKQETGASVVVSMMDVAASGGYYISLPADYIMAHPTTVTGSVGVIFVRPDISGLMKKLGIEVNVDASGRNKDMGSPFRKSSEKENRLFENLVESLGNRFLERVRKHRHLTGHELESIATARIFLADQALEKGMIDEIGYLPDCIEKAREMAGLPEDSRVVVYRRREFPNDNIYNPIQMESGMRPLVDLGLPAELRHRFAGFYYLWTPGLDYQ